MLKRYPDFSIGLEEELFVVDASSGQLQKNWPVVFREQCQKTYPNQITDEFLLSQIELITKPATDFCSLKDNLRTLRAFCINEGQKEGVMIMAAATHPTASWRQINANKAKRYQFLENCLKVSSHRMLVGGMHIHIGLSSIQKRLVLLNAISHYLPLILALSTSSPFWAGENTGHLSYRSSVISGLPRSGRPINFKSPKAYNAYLTSLIDSQCIDSARDIWWDARLSSRYPTVEIRVADTCTNINDAIAIAAFIRCLARYILERELKLTKSIKVAREIFWPENVWQAKRYAINDAQFLDDFGKAMTFSDAISELIDRLLPDAHFFNCKKELLHCLTILEKGTSAIRQQSIFQQALQSGGSSLQAFNAVKMHLMAETQNF